FARVDRSSALGFDSGVERTWRSAERAAQTRHLGQEVGHAGSYCLSRGRKKIQVPQASPAHAIQYDAGAVPRKMGIAAGLSHGCPELRGCTLAPCQTDGARPATAPAQVAEACASLTRWRPVPPGRLRECARPSNEIRSSAEASSARAARGARKARSRRRKGSL